SLFVTWPNGGISFRSGVWRDYFAANYMAKNNLHDEAAAQVGQSGWGGALRFLVAEVGGAELADRSLKTKELSPTRDVLFQVADWLPIAPDSGDWRRQTMILLGQMARQATFARVLRLRAIAALALSAEAGIHKFLAQLLERSDPFLRQAGAAALPALVADKVIDSLAGLLEDGDARVRQTAVYALGWLNHPNAEAPLLTALVQGDDDMRRVAVTALAQRGEEGQEILREALEDDDLRVRRAAVYGLTLLEADWVEPTLTDLTRHDSEWLVRTAATEALEQARQRHKSAPWHPVPVGKQEWLLDYARQEGRNVPEGAAILPFLVQLLTEAESPKDRLAAAVCLGQLLNESAAPALETAVFDADDQVKQAAFATLAKICRAI
ncbi:MAG: HEAT repeat domain-containing protein, partial [Anaerolineae bacterium]